MCMAVTRRGHERSQGCALHRLSISLAAHLLTAPLPPAQPYGLHMGRFACLQSLERNIDLWIENTLNPAAHITGSCND
jgi:hypothetical protein